MHSMQHWGYAATPQRDRDSKTEAWTQSLSLTLHAINQPLEALLPREVLIEQDDLPFAMASSVPPSTVWPSSAVLSVFTQSSRLIFLLTVHGVVKVNFVRREGSRCSGCACLPASNVTPDLHIFAELLKNVPNSPWSG